jgi:hypothetical protein
MVRKFNGVPSIILWNHHLMQFFSGPNADNFGSAFRSDGLGHIHDVGTGDFGYEQFTANHPFLDLNLFKIISVHFFPKEPEPPVIRMFLLFSIGWPSLSYHENSFQWAVGLEQFSYPFTRYIAIDYHSKNAYRVKGHLPGRIIIHPIAYPGWFERQGYGNQVFHSRFRVRANYR